MRRPFLFTALVALAAPAAAHTGQVAAIDVVRSRTVIHAPSNAGRAVERVRYCVTITNSGGAPAGAVEGTDQLPHRASYAPGSLRSGASCATATTIEDDDAHDADEADATSAGISDRTVSISRPGLAAANSFAVTYEALMN